MLLWLALKVKRMTRSEIRKIYGVDVPTKIDRDKLDTIYAGCELGYLTKEDIEFMILPTTTLVQAVNRMKKRRLEAED